MERHDAESAVHPVAGCRTGLGSGARGKDLHGPRFRSLAGGRFASANLCETMKPTSLGPLSKPEDPSRSQHAHGHAWRRQRPTVALLATLTAHGPHLLAALPPARAASSLLHPLPAAAGGWREAREVSRPPCMHLSLACCSTTGLAASNHFVKPVYLPMQLPLTT